MPSERFQNALNRVPQATPPIWFMRQAGRYHQHYQRLRAKHSFMELCKNPDLAAQVALGPVEDFDFDVAILFSDLLFPLEALGLSLTYGDSGPVLDPRLDENQIRGLRSVEEALPHLEFQRQAMRKTRALLPEDKSLIGFVGGPWTLFVYAVEGSHKGNLIDVKSSMRMYRSFAEILVPLLIENIRLQLDGGAEVVMIFDTAAGELSPDWFHREIAADLARIFAAFPGRIGYYARGTQPAHLGDARFGPGPLAGIGVDWRWDLREAFEAGNGVGFVQGNFDQSLLFLPPDEFQNELHSYLKPLLELSPKERRGWVCGLGHGVLPRTPEENVRTFVRTVREAFA
ncbi:MAG: uroporphyrinogen decarboxylase family protein [Thermoanaerobaculia bacterium]